MDDIFDNELEDCLLRVDRHDLHVHTLMVILCPVGLFPAFMENNLTIIGNVWHLYKTVKEQETDLG